MILNADNRIDWDYLINGEYSSYIEGNHDMIGLEKVTMSSIPYRVCDFREQSMCTVAAVVQLLSYYYKTGLYEDRKEQDVYRLGLVSPEIDTQINIFRQVQLPSIGYPRYRGTVATITELEKKHDLIDEYVIPRIPGDYYKVNSVNRLYVCTESCVWESVDLSEYRQILKYNLSISKDYPEWNPNGVSYKVGDIVKFGYDQFNDWLLWKVNTKHVSKYEWAPESSDMFDSYSNGTTEMGWILPSNIDRILQGYQKISVGGDTWYQKIYNAIGYRLYGLGE